MVDEAEAVNDRQELLAHQRHAEELQRHAVKEVEFEPERVDLGYEARSVEAFVECGAGEKVLEAGEVDRVRGHSRDDDRRGLGRGADAPGMAGGAVEEDAVEAGMAPERAADRARQPHRRRVGLVDHAEGGPALILPPLRKEVGKERGHRRPQDVGQAEVPVAAGRAVLEVLRGVGERLRRIGGEAGREGDGADDQQRRERDRSPGEDPPRPSHPPAPARPR